MNKALGCVLIVAAVVGVWNHVTAPPPAEFEADERPYVPEAREQHVEPAHDTQVERQDFRCDGRVWCREMTSCAEAMFFLDNCPGVKMDGEGDGIPCEDQWCPHR